MTRSQHSSQPDNGHSDQSGNGRLSKDSNAKKRQKQPNKTTIPFTHDLPHSKRECLAKLIGRKALTHYNLNELAVSALLDTGAQVIMIDWKGKYLTLLLDEDELRVYAVNGDVLPFDGWVTLTVDFDGE